MPFVRAARAHWLLVAVVAIVAVATALVWEETRAAKYSATAQILVTPVEGAAYAGLPAVVIASSADPARTLQTATSILESPAAAGSTARTLGRKRGQNTVSEAISVQPLGESDIVSVTGKAGSPAAAAKLANTYARSALSLHATLLSREAAAQIDQLRAREKLLSPGESAAAAPIATQLAALSSVAAGHDPNFSLLQAASVPTSADTPSKKLIVLLALIAGLAVGIGAATAIDYLNRRVRDEDELLSLYPLPVLARIPLLPGAVSEAVAPELVSPSAREAFRTLQIRLPPGSSRRGRAIMFTSPSPRDGKTSSAIHFALTLAAANFRVILFDFDLRGPDVGRLLGVRANFVDYFTMRAPLNDVLVDSQLASGLRVLSAGPQGDVTPTLEAVGRRLPDLLREARKLADYVIIDTPPLGHVSDALRAATLVDDIVLVVRFENTDRTALQRTRELLAQMGHAPTGLLVIGGSGTRDAYGRYGVEVHAEPNGGSSAGARVSSSLARADADPPAASEAEPADQQTKPIRYP